MSADVHALIGAYVLDAVDDNERRRVEEHLSECDSCAAEAAELRETVSRLSDTTITEPPPRMRERVLALARRTRQEAPPPVQTEPARPAAARILRPRRAPRLPRALAAAALALVIAVAGGVVTWAIMQRQAETETTEVDRMAAVLEAADAEVAYQDAEGGGRVTVVSSADLDQAVVFLSGLAEVGEDRSYQVWLVEAAEPVSAGVAEPGESSATMLVDGLGEAEVVGVTNEPAGGSETPTLPLVAGVELTA